MGHEADPELHGPFLCVRPEDGEQYDCECIPVAKMSRKIASFREKSTLSDIALNLSCLGLNVLGLKRISNFVH